MSIALFNPSIATENVGDMIIIDAILHELQNIFPKRAVVSIPTQDIIGSFSKRVANNASYRIVGGTNLLSSEMLKYKQWKVNLIDTIKLKDTTLMGVGWWQYQKNPDFYTRILLKRILSKNNIHSVRDEYTKNKLNSIGITNVLNTGCPTMWELTESHCKEIQDKKSNNVVLTLTDYKKIPELDFQLINILKKSYNKIFFWPQGSGDLNYIKNLECSGLIIIPPTLNSFNELLETENSLDYVGTRLHGGIRALQKKVRALILSVDNRSIEISKDTKLNVIDRHEINAIQGWIDSPEKTKININTKAIKQWRNQFKEKSESSLDCKHNFP